MRYDMHFSYFGRTVFLVLSLTAAVIGLFSEMKRSVTDDFLGYAAMQGKSICYEAVYDCVSDLKIDSGFIVNEEDGYTYDATAINGYLATASQKVFANVKKSLAGSDNNIYMFPLGLALNNPLLTRIGPEVPVTFRLIGDIGLNFVSDVTSFGINNALVKLILKVDVATKVTVPLASDINSFSVDIPIYVKVIEGEVPNFIYGTNNIAGVVKVYGTEVKA